MKNARSFFLFLTFLVMDHCLFGKEFPVYPTIGKINYPAHDRVSVNFLPIVNFLRDKSLFEFHFLLENKKTSVQPIVSISIETEELHNFIETPYGWVGSIGTPLPKERRLLPERIKWYATYAPDDPRGQEIPQSREEILDSIYLPGPNVLHPGNSLENFRLESIGLPGISKLYVEGWAPLFNIDSLLTEEDWKEYHQLTDNKKILDFHFQDFTVGPEKVDDLSPGNLLKRIYTLMDKARELNWASSANIQEWKPIIESLPNSIGTRNLSGTTIKSLEEKIILLKKKNSWNPNFYALMIPNIEYILHKLKNPDGK